ncbi:hypothetical protein SKAU_G00262210 [Synaphobranchus kaupii]|uniref:Uncharacterized protein n=1 Tax=Synaphobranchus kaupii TaxID=118154 RepID=A0A9Q1EYL3_SYNKA|nr:hypothetical protein SKAU_G00262210 [Synaphobranchus kaupii]
MMSGTGAIEKVEMLMSRSCSDILGAALKGRRALLSGNHLRPLSTRKIGAYELGDLLRPQCVIGLLREYPETESTSITCFRPANITVAL